MFKVSVLSSLFPAMNVSWQAPPHIVISLSLSLSVSLPLFLLMFIFRSLALTRSIYHWISGFLVVTPRRPWPILVPEQEQPIASEGPVTAPNTSVDAINETQPVDIVVPCRPDADQSGVHSDKNSGDMIRDWHDGHGSKEYSKGRGPSSAHGRCFTPDLDQTPAAASVITKRIGSHL